MLYTTSATYGIPSSFEVGMRLIVHHVGAHGTLLEMVSLTLLPVPVGHLQ